MRILKILVALALILSPTAQVIAVPLLLQGKEVQKLLLWKIMTTKGKQHWLLGNLHDITFNYFSTPAQQSLQRLLTQTDVFIHEVNMANDSQRSLASYQKLDQQLITMSRQLGKETVSLDTVLEEIQAYSLQLNIRAKLAAKDETLTEAEEEAAFDKLLDLQERLRLVQQAYFQGDHATLLELATQRSAVEKVFDEQLLDTRNRRWITRITAACEQDKTCLISVGLWHLVVDDDKTASIITLLREQGYRVELSE